MQTSTQTPIHARMTPAAHRTIARAIGHARRLSDGCVTIEHVLLALTETRDNHAASVLAGLGVTAEAILAAVPEPIMPPDPARAAYFSPAINRLMRAAAKAANVCGHENIGLQHVLMGIASDVDNGPVRDCFLSVGISLIRVRGGLRQLIERDDVQLGDLKASIRQLPATAAFTLEPEVDAEPVAAGY